MSEQPLSPVATGTLSQAAGRTAAGQKPKAPLRSRLVGDNVGAQLNEPFPLTQRGGRGAAAALFGVAADNSESKRFFHTEYSKCFQQSAVSPVKKCMPPHSLGIGFSDGNGEFRAATESRDEFPGYSVPPPVKRPVPKYKPSQLHQTATSVYRETFRGERGEVSKPMFKREYRPNPYPLECETESSESFKRYEGFKPPPICHPQSATIIPSPMVTKSDYHYHFIDLPLPERRKREAPQSTTVRRGVPLTGSSMYQKGPGSAWWLNEK